MHNKQHRKEKKRSFGGHESSRERKREEDEEVGLPAGGQTDREGERERRNRSTQTIRQIDKSPAVSAGWGGRLLRGDVQVAEVVEGVEAHPVHREQVAARGLAVEGITPSPATSSCPCHSSGLARDPRGGVLEGGGVAEVVGPTAARGVALLEESVHRMALVARLDAHHVLLAVHLDALPESLVFLHSLAESSHQPRLRGEPDELLDMLPLLRQQVQDELRIRPEHTQLLQDHVDLSEEIESLS